MNPTKHRNPGRAAARVFTAMVPTATFFLVPGVARAADEATADTADIAMTEESITADAVTTDATTVSSEADTSICAVMRTTPVGTTATLDHGHADIFDLTSDAPGTLTLRIKEDTTGSDVVRESEQILLAVNRSTLTQIPASVSQVTGVLAATYLLGQFGGNQATVLWLGWDILGITADGHDAARSHISHTGSENGHIYAFASSLTEDTKAVTDGGSFDLAPEGDGVDQPYVVYKHINQLPTRVGRYMLAVQASVWTPDSAGAINTVAPAHTYTIDVVDEASCLAGSRSAPSTDQVQPTPAPGMGGATGMPSAPVPVSGTTGMTGAIGTTTGANPALSLDARTTSGATGNERCAATRITCEATEAKAATLVSNNIPANTARTTLTVSVGDGASGNTTDGYSDLGPAIENGMLVTRVRDDRAQPVQWVSPPSLTFTLGDAACITAPADFNFVTTPDSSVRLIPSTRVAGMSWLGLNSRYKEIVIGTTGPVQFTLGTVGGPGRVAIFNAGALGSGVGEHVFDDPGAGYTLGTNTHAHQNRVFVAPGTYTLTITVRATPSGAALAGSSFGSGGDLTATGATGPNGRPMIPQVVDRTVFGKGCGLSLTTTGADTIPLAVVSPTWALTDAACMWVGVIGHRRSLCRAL